MFFSRSKQTTSFLLFEAWIPVTHTPLPFSLSFTTCISLLSFSSLFLFPLFPPLLPSFSCSCFLSFFFFFLCYHGIAAFHVWVTFSPAKARQEKKSNACVYSLPLWLCVSLSVGKAAFLQGALITSVGLPLSVKLFPIETCQPAT